jgi:hypothetical protein
MQTTTTPFRITLILGDKPVAQVESIQRIIGDGGEILGTSMLPAESLSLPLSAEILGEITAALLAEIASLKAAAATLNDLRTERDAAKAALAEHQAISDRLVVAARTAIAANDVDGIAEILHQASLFGSSRESAQIDIKTAELLAEIDALTAAKAAL